MDSFINPQELSNPPCKGVKQAPQRRRKHMINWKFWETSRAPMRFPPWFSLSSREKARQNLSLIERSGLAVGGVEAGEDFGTGAELGLAEAVERGLDGVEKFVEVAGIGFDKQQ